MERIARALLLLALPLSAAGATELRPQDPEGVPQEPQTSAEGTLLGLGQIDQRLTVPVAVGAKGPYNFIIDTGAERTSVSRELAGTLQLTAGQPIRVTTMTGTSQVGTVIVPELAIESIGVRHTITAPAFSQGHLGAAGLLGIDTLQTNMVTIDFEAGNMMVRKSTPRRRSYSRDPNEIVVTAKSKFGQLIVTDASVGDTRIQVVLDTGSQVTLGNSALRNRVSRQMSVPRPIELIGVTGERVAAKYTLVQKMKIGNVEFEGLPVAFADVAPFRKFGLEKRPALLLGMDALRSFRRVEIDFPNRQVRFHMARAGYKPKI